MRGFMRKLLIVLLFAGISTIPPRAQAQEDQFNPVTDVITREGCIFRTPANGLPFAAREGGSAFSEKWSWSGPCESGRGINGRGTLTFTDGTNLTRRETGEMIDGLWHGTVTTVGEDPDGRFSFTDIYDMGCSSHAYACTPGRVEAPASQEQDSTSNQDESEAEGTPMFSPGVPCVDPNSIEGSATETAVSGLYDVTVAATNRCSQTIRLGVRVGQYSSMLTLRGSQDGSPVRSSVPLGTGVAPTSQTIEYSYMD